MANAEDGHSEAEYVVRRLTASKKGVDKWETDVLHPEYSGITNHFGRIGCSRDVKKTTAAAKWIKRN